MRISLSYLLLNSPFPSKAPQPVTISPYSAVIVFFAD